ncbi:hypothetical protein CAPTEDRAFT_207772 [Capitella teleta]|uniref:Acyl-ACP thioesterase-like C-terminal domain-containing protein n=1 Tax=Capitella teleta TaxID=283909 RepID=R7U4L9_CAPTE|nr:hypothetical protein CAPTEDRAFT_207772 [Capitella teleta]|eukprot:ELT98110.1 hypothetical protein CAPTEDRAFT_207772 [Capitella teleta]
MYIPEHMPSLTFIRTHLFDHEDFNRASRISMRRIARYMQWSRMVVYQPKFITNDLFKDNTHRLFATSMEYTMHPPLYEVSADWQRSPCIIPSLISTRLVSTGRSTVDLETTISTVDSKQLLASLKCKFTFVDLQTRKSDVLPESFKRAVSKYPTTQGLGRFTPVERPPDVFQYSFRVRPSDTDFNKHTNNASYLQWCLDTASIAFLEGRLSSFTRDPLYFDVYQMSMWYVGESFMGSLLSCSVWPDQKNLLMLHFVIESKGKILFHCCIEFYSGHISKL